MSANKSALGLTSSLNPSRAHLVYTPWKWLSSINSTTATKMQNTRKPGLKTRLRPGEPPPIQLTPDSQAVSTKNTVQAKAHSFPQKPRFLNEVIYVCPCPVLLGRSLFRSHCQPACPQPPTFSVSTWPTKKRVPESRSAAPGSAGTCSPRQDAHHG